MAKTDWKFNDIVTETDMNELGQEVNDAKADFGDMASVPTEAKDVAGAIGELHAKKLDQAGGKMTGALFVETAAREISAGSWADMSANSTGYALFAQNCYTANVNEYRYSNTHATLGARGIRFNQLTASVEYFDTGATATTADLAFTPNWINMRPDAAATANRTILRDANGRGKVAPPIAADDIARLDTVTSAVNALATVNAINYFVRPDGNDSNNGLADSASGAFKTIQKAINILPKKLMHNISIYVTAGTYNEVVSINGFTGQGLLTIVGDSVSGSTSNSRSVLGFFIQRNTCYVAIKGFTVTRTDIAAIHISGCQFVYMTQGRIITSAPQSGVYAEFSKVQLDNFVIGNRNPGIYAFTNSEVMCESTSGSGNLYAYGAAYGGKLALGYGNTITGTNESYVVLGGILVRENELWMNGVDIANGKTSLLPTGTNLNNVTLTGKYNGDGLVNRPSGTVNWIYVDVINHTSFYWTTQTCYDFYTTRTWTRRMSNSVWTDWVEVFTTGNNQGNTAINGYQKLASGLILQWGSVNLTANTFATVNFPLSYTTAVFAVNSTLVGNTANAVSTSNINYAQFRLVCPVNAQALWFALGY